MGTKYRLTQSEMVVIKDALVIADGVYAAGIKVATDAGDRTTVSLLQSRQAAVRNLAQAAPTVERLTARLAY